MPKNLLRPFAALCLLSGSLSGCLLGSFSGQVVAVEDGESLTIRYQDTTVRVRLHAVACPELSQPYGTRAKRVTEGLALEQPVKVEVITRDGPGRMVADVILPGGQVLNETLVDLGACWWDRRAAPADRMLEYLEAGARDGRRGLWAEPDAVPPWEYRRFKEGRP